MELSPASVAAAGGLRSNQAWELEQVQKTYAQGLSSRRTWGPKRTKPSHPQVTDRREQNTQLEPKFQELPEAWDLSSMPSRNPKEEMSLSRAGQGEPGQYPWCLGGGCFCP
jgi:hypothetical protein